MDVGKETIVSERSNFAERISSLLASVQTRVFHATEVYSILDVTEVKYNMKKLSVDEREVVTARIKSKNFKAFENIQSTCC